MNTALVIRTIGYVVYALLWMPVIIVLSPIAFIVLSAYAIHLGTFKDWLVMLRYSLILGVKHDINFIKTGEW